MSRIRILITRILPIALVGLLAFAVITGRLPPKSQPKDTVPLELKEITPPSWHILPDYLRQCDLDGDGVQEWLALYNYDATGVPGSAEGAKDAVQHALIGGVVYDMQTGEVPPEVRDQTLYPPGLLIPYKLLPDIYVGKGQGYLGETKATVSLYPASSNNKACVANEITIAGYSGTPWPTRLSIFQWDPITMRYLVAHFVGNARVVPAPVPSAAQRVATVLTYNRLDERSLLCQVQGYTRVGATLDFPPDPERHTIDFCFETPADPTYPEGVVVALLRGHNPAAGPTGASFLTPQGRDDLPDALVNLKEPQRPAYRIQSLTVPGTVAAPGTGEKQEKDNQIWWWGRESIQVQTELFVNNQLRRAVWSLISITSDKMSADSYWRVDKVEISAP
jgi:hypothetical protein